MTLLLVDSLISNARQELIRPELVEFLVGVCAELNVEVEAMRAK